jgi:hypothetical protein
MLRPQARRARPRLVELSSLVGLQELEQVSREAPLLLQPLGLAGLDDRSSLDVAERLVVPLEQLAQLGTEVGLRRFGRHGSGV